ncbi:MAG: MetQ/NlpA family ABC transporter substrate-binding protein [Clostridium sp.]|nr:MetQ/NlpA family ABC transporter substrate-binding protein [Clostridium sp.]MDU7084460.1 MetQ/NlpA family ABC transporter substrate-binding protein [Clostridium sp.]
MEPQKPIVESAIKPLLEVEGYKVEIVEFTDYILSNTALACRRRFRCKLISTRAILKSTVKEKNYNLNYRAKVHFEPMGVYFIFSIFSNIYGEYDF